MTDTDILIHREPPLGWVIVNRPAAARETGNRGIQLHGGIGFTWEHNLHLY